MNYYKKSFLRGISKIGKAIDYINVIRKFEEKRCRES